ncbi:dihydroxyacetone kinase subunit L [Rhizobiaceae bacterium n13]|uniref:Dihydroxyacetone kinase subunit L n=1 Tax=Ferirhizobium litorale TaxID=2927786 RepID=A0AAE3Q9X6_9HYPH|nr:dihydroxyacetone kinase subunit DhaL [Fererhizobium litorale]MDI7861751.1 dihydroxyacetone kinase subunit L [Fererhizobium litorale]MDI7921907.1 dihydroxyacetone kinase subunit L [Fererhizobium litorale]
MKVRTVDQEERVLADRGLIAGLIETCSAAIAAHADHLCLLDSAIGDGDHGTNMKRGFDALRSESDALSALPLAQAIERIGVTLVMNVGGAAGPLYGTLLIEIGRSLGTSGADTDLPDAFGKAVDAVARRGRALPGDKTLLDVLYPVHAELVRHAAPDAIAGRAESAARHTIGMRAMRGRAAYLGDRSIGHIDPGASSCALLTSAICRYIEEYRPA